MDNRLLEVILSVAVEELKQNNIVLREIVRLAFTQHQREMDAKENSPSKPTQGEPGE